MSDYLHSLALKAVEALLSDDHSAEAGDAALREILAEVVELGGLAAITDLAVELTSKLAELVEQAAAQRGLMAIDIVDLLIVDRTHKGVRKSGNRRGKSEVPQRR